MMRGKVSCRVVAVFLTLILGITYAQQQQLVVWTNIVPGDVTRAPALAEIIAEFERLNPDIKVAHDAFGFQEHSTSVKLAVQGGTGPDVLMSQVGADAQDRYFRDGLLVDLAPIAVERGWTERYEPWVLAFPNLAYPDSDSWDGPQLAVIPAYMNLLGIYYNRDMFNELGLSEPTTWAEFEHVIVTLKENGITPFAFGNLEKFHFLHMAWAAMHASTPPERVKAWYYMIDPEVRLTDADFVRGLTWLQSLATQGYVNADFNAVSREDLYNMLYSRQFGMVVLGTWALRRFSTEAPFEVGFFPIPMMDPGMTRGIVGDMGWGFGILAASDKLDAAVKFLDFTTSEFAAEAWYRHANIPAMKLPAGDVEPAYALQGEFYNRTGGLVIGQFMDTAAPGLRAVAEVEGQRLMSGQIAPEDWARAAQAVFAEWGQRIGRLP